jgi:nitrogen fixation-related uncharacterized protein
MRLNSMTIVYATIPLMLLAVAIAVMPLVWSIAHQARRNEFDALTPMRTMAESRLETDRAA